mgnify:CR=1 FL=1
MEKELAYKVKEINGFTENDYIEEEMFAPLQGKEKELVEIERPSIGYWSNAWRKLRENKVALFSMILIIFGLALSILASRITKAVRKTVSIFCFWCSFFVLCWLNCSFYSF